ncbi:uncharacterized protein LOC133306223 [Gastrolobium bilobum]|uniref:uncharacterized protein LOC133306223 n=1 Tax=Gastrolobium bilobum TaxID=150636 RepID=UPI002AB05638|nr:uncharacterized protein LOC133306223 [Gastrolobium bilobum]
MKKGLENIWARDEQIFVTDVENSFFLVRFTKEKDMEFALTAGPWVLFDHYLAIRLWEPDFQSYFASINQITAWVRLPSFPVEYVNTGLLKTVGNWLGKFVRMDAATTCLARGKVTRICVELDLSKPLQAEYKIEVRLKMLSMKGYLYCLSKATHLSSSLQDTNMSQREGESIINDSNNQENKEDERYGPRMLVNKQKGNSKSGPSQVGKKEGSSSLINHKVGKTTESRFSVLNQEERTEH